MPTADAGIPSSRARMARNLISSSPSMSSRDICDHVRRIRRLHQGAMRAPSDSAVRPDSTAAYRSERMSTHVLPSGAFMAMSTTKLVAVAASPTHLDRTVRIGEFGCEPDAFDGSRKHQLRVGAVRQAGDVNGGVEQCDRRRLRQADIGVQSSRRRPARADRPSERLSLDAPRLLKLGDRRRVVAGHFMERRWCPCLPRRRRAAAQRFWR